jgi:microtubule-associated protein-like 6
MHTYIHTCIHTGTGDKLVSVGLDPDHSIAVVDAQTGAKIASATGSAHRIFCVAFNPQDDSIVTAGVYVCFCMCV